MRNSRTQIIATIGPTSKTKEVISDMIDNGMDVARLNFSWGTHKGHGEFIKIIREVAKEKGKVIPIIQDIAGPRKMEAGGHEFDKNASVITEKDKKDLEFTIQYKLEYVAMSYVGTSDDVIKLRMFLDKIKSESKIIAKIERQEAVNNIDEILDAADAIMVARGDLSKEVSVKELSSVQHSLVKLANKKGKPVIVATGMLLSMMEDDEPSQRDINDITNAILTDADAVMLSNETAIGKLPVESVKEMEKIILEAEKRNEDYNPNEL